MEDRERFEEEVSTQRQYTFFTKIDRAFDRTEGILKMIRNFSGCVLRDLANDSLEQLTDTNKIMAMDVYDRPVGDVTAMLKPYGIGFTERQVPESEACSLNNLRKMSWTVSRGSRVELLTYQDRVVGIHSYTRDE